MNTSDLKGYNAIVTGGSTGLGYEISKAFLKAGASVMICSRNANTLANARAKLEALCSPEQQVLAVTCDVGSYEQVLNLVQRSLDAFGRIQILVNNAAILGPIGRTDELLLGELRTTIDTNIYGVLQPCYALLPHMRLHHRGKIINLSGGGATSPRPFFSAYAMSKAAVVRLTENLAVELRGSGVDVNAVAPGALNTRMLEQTLTAGEDKIGEAQFADAVRQRKSGGSSIRRAADLCVYLASAASDGITGRLISAPWDPWPRLRDYADELANSDIYTLRRIVPKDRAKNWN